MHGLPPPPVDKRSLSWAELERDIAERASKRDPEWRPSGTWRTFLHKEWRGSDYFDCYAVDGLWVYNNLTVLFGTGGHGYTHEVIPLDEIWVASNHYANEDGTTYADGAAIEGKERDAIIVHEIAEAQCMRLGESFWAAHNYATEVEEQWLANYGK
jgi:hypothetical protein